MPELPDESTLTPEWPVYCELRPEQPAIAMCTRCGAFIGRSSWLVNDGGLAECPRCHKSVSPVRAGLERPGGSAVVRFVRTVRDVLLSPSDFVRRLDPKGRLAPALWFGVICIILGELAALGWTRLLMPADYAQMVEEQALELELTHAQVELMLVTALPLGALLQLALSGLMLHLGALLSGARQLLRYRDYVRVFSYASAAYLLLLVPLDAGIILAFLCVLAICARALRVHHRLSTRQTVIATVPLAVGMVFLHMGF